MGGAEQSVVVFQEATPQQLGAFTLLWFSSTEEMHTTPVTKFAPVIAMGAGGSHAETLQNQTYYSPEFQA